MKVDEIKISDFDYPLPDEQIARHPLAQRDACRLFRVEEDGSYSHNIFREIPKLLSPDTLLVCNNTRVINARIVMHKATGARIEIFCLEPEQPRDYAQMFAATGSCRWGCMIGNLKKWKDEPLTAVLSLSDGSQATLTARHLGPLQGSHEVEFSWTPAQLTFATIIEAAGNIPIPPYLNRESEKSDAIDYQTVYAKDKGSVAAPTAGLHFTPELLDELASAGIERRELTLHVGAGTFQPVKSEMIGGHEMHTELFSVSKSLIEELIEALEAGKTIGAVGTTTVRTLESLPYIGRHIMNGQARHVTQWEAYNTPDFDTITALQAIVDYLEANGESSLPGTTSIMIAPGFKWRVVSEMITNFHQPQSTLLLLVSSFLERNGINRPWRRYYDEALAQGYRFLSYGDAMLLH